MSKPQKMISYDIQLFHNYNPTEVQLCILLYSSIRSYVELYRSGLFTFGYYVSLPTLFG